MRLLGKQRIHGSCLAEVAAFMGLNGLQRLPSQVWLPFVLRRMPPSPLRGAAGQPRVAVARE